MTSLELAHILAQVPAVSLIGAELYQQYRPQGALIPTGPIPKETFQAAVQQMVSISRHSLEMINRLTQLRAVPLQRPSLDFAL